MSILQMAAIAGNGAAQTYVDDVFSAYTYIGNGSTQTITNGIDLAGKGGLLWIKDRGTGGACQHHLVDTEGGASEYMFSNGTQGRQSSGSSEVTAFNSNGFSLGSGGSLTNYNTYAYASWSFRKAAKFFDVVTYTGNGTTQTINHSLGIAPGMIIVKKTSGTGDWYVYHRANTANPETDYLRLNTTTGTADDNTVWNDTLPTSTNFTVADAPGVNFNGHTYVAYLFAHDTATDGIIQCGSFTTDGSGNATVNLGWEPQFVICKPTNTAIRWSMLDTARGWTVTNDAELAANSSAAENTPTTYGAPTATGFTADNNCYGSSNTVVYLAIRRPNKPPTSGTQVYEGTVSNAATGTQLTTGFPVDMQLLFDRSVGGVGRTTVADRLRGASSTSTPLALNLITSSSSAEANTYNATRNWNNTGFEMPNSFGGESMVFHSFRRAPGVFDVVCYTGVGSATTVSHNLGVAPELMLVKNRTVANSWACYSATLGNTKFLVLNATDAEGVYDVWNNTSPTTSVFSLSAYTGVNGSAKDYVAYLFATKAGISKVGSYTGNGSNQTINCGFTTGARFILIKRTDSTGDWFLWDSARGIVAGNDPHLSLNNTDAEVTTDDSIDPDVSGFIVNQDGATNINVNAATYIYLALS